MSTETMIAEANTLIDRAEAILKHIVAGTKKWKERKAKETDCIDPTDI